jgi:hypothetical protein
MTIAAVAMEPANSKIAVIGCAYKTQDPTRFAHPIRAVHDRCFHHPIR